MTNKEIEWHKSQDWAWLSNWFGGMIKDMQNEGYTEEQVIEELGKYGDVRTIEGEREDEKKKY